MTLRVRLLDWKPHLDYLPDDPIPLDQQNSPKPPSVWTTLYMTLAALIFVAITVVGAGRLVAWLGWAEWQAAIAPLADVAEVFFAIIIGLVGAALVLALMAYAFIRLYIRLRRSV